MARLKFQLTWCDFMSSLCNWLFPENSQKMVFSWEKKEGKGYRLKSSNLAKTILDLLNVFCYHFTTDLHREISTEQAESLLGSLTDKGISAPAQECHHSTRDPTISSNRRSQHLPDLTLCAGGDVTISRTTSPRPSLKSLLCPQQVCVCEGRLTFSSGTKPHLCRSATTVFR